MMVYGYIRVSTEMQTVENQRFEVTHFLEKQGMKVDGWIEETVSGTKEYSKRALGQLLKDVTKGDLIVCAEISRLGRSLFMIMEILSICMKKECQVWTIKDGYRLGDDMQSKVLAFAFGLSAEIERNLISQRTTEALKRLKAEGKVLGRPVGTKSSHTKLSGHEEEIRSLLEARVSQCEIAKRLDVNRNTLAKFISDHDLAEGLDLSNPIHTKRPSKLEGHEDEVREMFKAGESKSGIAKAYKTTIQTLDAFMDEKNILDGIDYEAAKQARINAQRKSPLDGEEGYIRGCLSCGKKVKALAEEYGVTENVMRTFIKKNNLEAKKNG